MASIIAPWVGCRKVESLKGEPMVFYVIGDGVSEFRAGAWQGDTKGCEPTTHHQRELLIDGGTKALKSLGDGEMRSVEFDYEHWDQCGRAQVDIKHMGTGEFAAAMLDYGVDCGKPAKPVLPPSPIDEPPPAIELPLVYTEVPILPPGVPEQFDHAAIPEPATLILLGSALLGAGLRNKVLGRKVGLKR